MNEDILVSVITPVYQNFERLYDTIESVLMQDYEKIEYIICDDGSKDFPQNDIEKYIESHKRKNLVKYIILTSEVNRGITRNLNNACKNSKGDIVMNLTRGDVFFSSDVISRIVGVFRKKNSDIVVASRVLYKGQYEPMYFLPHHCERKIIERFDTPYKQYRAFITSKFYDMASGCAMYFTRNILEELGYYDTRYTLWDDGPLLAKYLHDRCLTFAYDIIAIWYQYGGLSTNRDAPQNPILKQDSMLFSQTEKLEHLDELDLFARMTVKYNAGITCAASVSEKIRIALRYPYVYFSKKLYEMSRKMHARYDRFYMPNIISENIKKNKVN